jgi:hypothetical protein
VLKARRPARHERVVGDERSLDIQDAASGEPPCQYVEQFLTSRPPRVPSATASARAVRVVATTIWLHALARLPRADRADVPNNGTHGGEGWPEPLHVGLRPPTMIDGDASRAPTSPPLGATNLRWWH